MSVATSKVERKARAATAPGDALLAWYDRHRRLLPWRALSGETADPYRVWLSEIMLQQTTVKTVGPYFAKFLALWPDVKALARAPLDDVLRAWAGLGYYARARNLHACAIAVAEQHGGIFPHDEAGLRALPGVGDYTAAAVAAIAFDVPTTPVDGNIERVISRMFAIDDELPRAKPRIRALAESLRPARSGDYAQALMDLGSSICTPRKPACVLCPWQQPCAARAAGTQETYPRKAPKVSGVLRRGTAFWVERADGAVLVRTRASSGLLGGMTEIPTTVWSAEFDAKDALAAMPEVAALASDWRRLVGVVTHVFTHFPLELTVFAARVPARTKAPEGARWVAAHELDAEALPTVMRKVIAHAREFAETEIAANSAPTSPMGRGRHAKRGG